MESRIDVSDVRLIMLARVVKAIRIGLLCSRKLMEENEKDVLKLEDKNM